MQFAGIVFKITPIIQQNPHLTIDYLADIGTDVDNGARPLARALYNVITAPIAHIILKFDRSNPKNFHTFFIEIKGRAASEIDFSLVDERKVIFHARP